MVQLRYVTGDECGVLKESLPIVRQEKLDVTGGHVKLITPIDQMARSNGIVDLKWFGRADPSGRNSSTTTTSSFGTLLIDGRVHEYTQTRSAEKKIVHPKGNHTTASSTAISSSSSSSNNNKPQHATYQLVRQSPKLYDSGGADDDEIALGLHHFPASNKVGVVSTKGRMTVFDWKRSSAEDDEDGTDSGHGNTKLESVVQTFRAYETKKMKDQQQQIQQSKDDTTILVTAHASNPVDEGFIALGGKERETVLLDINNGGTIVWKAKNLPPDPRTLLHHQVWPTAACFMDRHTLVVGTAYHQIRIYDIRTMQPPSSSSSTLQQQQQRRPVAYSPFDESLFAHRITALCPKRPMDGDVVFVGDSAGFLSAIDVRMLKGGAIVREKAHKAVVGRYVGPAGSIRSIQSDGRVMACVGLDRMLRIFDIPSRRQIHAVYLKQRLNGLLLSSSSDDDDSVTTDRTTISRHGRRR